MSSSKKTTKSSKTTSVEESPRKLSALAAAAQVLAESKEPLNAKQMIEAMASNGYWTSPGGKTPHATLYAAILREITVKGAESRFTKTSKGHFTLSQPEPQEAPTTGSPAGGRKKGRGAKSTAASGQ